MHESRSMANVPVIVVGNKQDLVVPGEAASPPTSSAMSSALVPVAQQPHAVSAADDRRRDIANLVKKHWKCAYIECSAKFNSRIVGIFKELITMVDSIEAKADQSPMLDNIHEALDRNKCVLL